MGGDGREQSPGNLVGICVEEANPLQPFDACEFFQQQSQAVFQPKILAVARGVLSDERDFAYAGLRQALGLGDNRFETPRAELSAKLRNDAEAAGMVAAFGDFYIGRGSRRGQYARRVVVVKIVGQIGDGAVPGIAREASLSAAMIALGPRGQEIRRQDIERRRSAGCFRYSNFRQSSSGQNFLQFAGADDRVHFRNVLSNLVVKTLDQATGHHQPLGLAARFVTSHFEDGIDGFLLRAADKGTGIHHDDVGVLRIRSKLGAGLGQHAHHDLAIDEVFGAAEAHKTHLGWTRRPGSRGYDFLYRHWYRHWTVEDND